ncbi:hypothetical protein Tco_1525177 [Tanacetum coccineum]
MIGREILGSFCVNYFKFKLLKEENPPEQSRLGIFFSKEIFEGGVIRIHNAFVQDEDDDIKFLKEEKGEPTEQANLALHLVLQRDILEPE